MIEAKIRKDGALEILPETELEIFALGKWIVYLSEKGIDIDKMTSRLIIHGTTKEEREKER